MNLSSRDISIHPRSQRGEEIVKNLILMIAIFVAFPVFGQGIQQAPTVAQCQADRALWQSQASFFFKQKTAYDIQNTLIMKLTAKEIRARSNEMGDCLTVDSRSAK